MTMGVSHFGAISARSDSRPCIFNLRAIDEAAKQFMTDHPDVAHLTVADLVSNDYMSYENCGSPHKLDRYIRWIAVV